MKQNNRKKTWKAIVAVMLVMAMLMSMTSLVNAGIVEKIFGEEYAEVELMSSSSENGHQCNIVIQNYTVGNCGANLGQGQYCSNLVGTYTWICTVPNCPKYSNGVQYSLRCSLHPNN